MRFLLQTRLRLRSLLRRQRAEAELDEELQYHLERQIEENLAAGMLPEEARYAALRSLRILSNGKKSAAIEEA